MNQLKTRWQPNVDFHLNNSLQNSDLLGNENRKTTLKFITKKNKI